MLTIHCLTCPPEKADKPAYMFVPSQQRSAAQGRAAYCMFCQRKQRGRISEVTGRSAGRPKADKSRVWRHNLYLPGSPKPGGKEAKS